MTETIRNPLVWSADQVAHVLHHLGGMGDRLGGGAREARAMPKVREIGMEDIEYALRKGVEDLAACRSDAALAILIYPVIGLVIFWMSFQQNFIHLLFPAIAGFALLGPAAAIGLYEMSRRRERGEHTSWFDGLRVLGSPAVGAILGMGLILLAIFVVWLSVAKGIYDMTMGPEEPTTLLAFIGDVFGTGAGWAMIALGVFTGFLFAALVLSISIVSFPLLLDRDVGLPAAMVTSVRVAAASPRTTLVWGLVVAAGLTIGAIPLFLGLIVTMPVLGHATWHLYRRAVVPEGEAL